MGLTDFFSDVISSWGFPEAQAEAPAENKEEESSAQQEEPEVKADNKAEEESSEKSEDSAEDAPEESSEEEEKGEDEPEDIKPKLEEECANSAQCAPYKHHYDECVERVTSQQEDEDYKGPKEDCVEEFFHLAHCATQCAAPKLFKALK
ncbi:ubiquinol-cytochrome C reductase hinge protein-domain-containing protein [Aspergillus venezuelensis]